MSSSRSPAACTRVVARLDPWIDGALDATEAALDRGHMEACAACDEERDRRLRMLEHVRGALRADVRDVDALWPDLAARLGARLEDGARARSRPLRGPALLGAAAAILVLSLLRVALTGPVRTPHPEDVVSMEHVLDALPRWSDVVRGVGSLSRSFS